MNFLRASAVALSLAVAPPAIANSGPNCDALWNYVTHGHDCRKKDFGDFIMVACNPQTLWFFTKRNNPAHPAAVRKTMGTPKADAFGCPGAPQDAAAVGAWIKRIRDLGASLGAQDRNPGHGNSK